MIGRFAGHFWTCGSLPVELSMYSNLGPNRKKDCSTTCEAISSIYLMNGVSFLDGRQTL